MGRNMAAHAAGARYETAAASPHQQTAGKGQPCADAAKNNFVAGLEAKFGRGVYDYELYYLIAQTTAPAKCRYFDFPGADSVAKFITETL